MFFRFTIDIFTLVAFGTELGSFNQSEQHPFAVCGEASRLTSEGTQLGFSPWLAHGSHEATMLEKTE